MKIKMIILAACMALLAGCSSGPSESVMENQVEESYSKMFKIDFVKINNFEKTNGRESGEDYLADLSYDIEFTKGIGDVAKKFGKKSGLGFRSAGMMLKSVFGNFKSGDSKHMDITDVKFSESENGWVITK